MLRPFLWLNQLVQSLSIHYTKLFALLDALEPKGEGHARTGMAVCKSDRGVSPGRVQQDRNKGLQKGQRPVIP